MYGNPVYLKGYYYFLQADNNAGIVTIHKYLPGEEPKPVAEFNIQEVNLYVVAYKKVDGVDKVLGRTVTAHVVGRKNAKFSNPKKLTITSKTKVSLKTGKTTKVKAKVTLVSPKRKSLSDGHAPLLRQYVMTSDL